MLGALGLWIFAGSVAGDSGGLVVRRKAEEGGGGELLLSLAERKVMARSREQRREGRATLRQCRAEQDSWGGGRLKGAGGGAGLGFRGEGFSASQFS